MKFIETSAKTDQKVGEAFETLADEIIKSNVNKEKAVVDKKDNVKLGNGYNLNEKKNKNKCC
jgi:hypothetical protein